MSTKSPKNTKINMGKRTTFPITSNKDLKVGVFICHCGGNISDIVDIEELKKAIVKEDVEVIEEFENLCSLNGRKIIRDKIINNHLDRVVVAACSPVSHEKTFQDYIKPLNPYLLDMANIREQCSWVHNLENDCSKSCSKKGNSAGEIISCEERKIKKSLAKNENNLLNQIEENKTSQLATKKAITLVKASIEKVKQSQAVDPILCQTPENAAVIGGGISGISSALSLAKQGLKTYLIEQNPSIGGEMVKIGKVFSPVKLAEECGMCLLNPIMTEAIWHDNIEILTNTKVVSAERRAGNFNLVLENNPRYVDIEKCISCGKCADVCPVKVSDSWNDGLSQRKAIYKPFSQAYPDAYTIDMEACKKCGNCQKMCRMDAIYLEGEKEMIPLNVGSVVLATGHQTLNPDIRPEYGHKQYADVITQMELGRLLGVNGPTKGKLKMLSRESEGKVPRRIVMIQCVGSRDEKPDGHKYCSKVCCMVALKNANIIKHKYPNTDVIICYTDMRTPGMYEKYYKHGQDQGIRFIRGRPGEVIKKNNNLVVRVEDTLQKEFVEVKTDMVVLSMAMESSVGTKEIAEIMDVSLTEDMFIKETHPKIKPVATDVKGAFVCGTAQGPKDITDSIMQSNAASSKVAEIMNDGLEIEPFIAEIDPEKCDLCGDCINICKYKAMSIKDKEVYIDPMSCSGCGKCLTRCTKDAINIHGNIDEKIFATISGMLEGKSKDEQRILVFLDHVGYTAADNIGVNRLGYPESIHIIKVHSVNRVMPKHIIYALENGADGVFIGEYPGDLMYEEVERKMQAVKEKIAKNNMNPERLEFSNVYIPYFRGLADKFKVFNEKIASLKET